METKYEYMWGARKKLALFYEKGLRLDCGRETLRGFGSTEDSFFVC